MVGAALGTTDGDVEGDAVGEAEGAAEGDVLGVVVVLDGVDVGLIEGACRPHKQRGSARGGRFVGGGGFSELGGTRTVVGATHVASMDANAWQSLSCEQHRNPVLHVPVHVSGRSQHVDPAFKQRPLLLQHPLEQRGLLWHPCSKVAGRQAPPKAPLTTKALWTQPWKNRVESLAPIWRGGTLYPSTSSAMQHSVRTQLL